MKKIFVILLIVFVTIGCASGNYVKKINEKSIEIYMDDGVIYQSYETEQARDKAFYRITELFKRKVI